MNRILRYACIACLPPLSACATASADPPPVAWETPLGRVVYDSERGQDAIFSYRVPFTDGAGVMVIHGLAGEFGGPGPLEGYWTEPDAAPPETDDACPFAIVDAAGRTTRNWGRLRLMFPGDDFPGDWLALRGRCLSEPSDVLSARLADR
jgi:hypothetical protein